MQIFKGISELLKPYANIVGKAAFYLTILQFFGGAFLCNDIRKRGSSDGFPLVPLLGLPVLCGISIPFGFLIGDDVTIKVNFIGFSLGSIYCLIYYFFTPAENRTKVWAKIGYGGAICIGIIAYGQYEDPALVEFRYGMIVTVLLLALIGSPLLDLPSILRRKTTEGMPFAIIFSGALCGLAWLTYGIALNNDFIIIQNIVAVGLSMIQLSLFVVFPSKPVTVDKLKKSK